jgi:hypothetical protein
MHNNCARCDFLYIRGWMHMAFYYHMIYFPETDNQVRHCSWLQSLGYNRRMCTIIHTLCIMRSWCRIESVLLLFWLPHRRIAASTAVNWLLILFPTGWAGHPLRPLIHGDPISLRVHALLLLSARYNNVVTLPYGRYSYIVKFVTANILLFSTVQLQPKPDAFYLQSISFCVSDI